MAEDVESLIDDHGHRIRRLEDYRADMDRWRGQVDISINRDIPQDLKDGIRDSESGMNQTMDLKIKGEIGEAINKMQWRILLGVGTIVTIASVGISVVFTVTGP